MIDFQTRFQSLDAINIESEINLIINKFRDSIKLFKTQTSIIIIKRIDDSMKIRFVMNIH